MRWSWVNFPCRGVLLVWIRVGQGPTALAIGAGGGCLDIFALVCPFSPLSPSLWKTTPYRLKYCLKGSLSPKTTNQPTNKNICYNLLLELSHLMMVQMKSYMLQHIFLLTLKAPNKMCSRQHFNFFTFSVWKKIRLDFSYESSA